MLHVIIMCSVSTSTEASMCVLRLGSDARQNGNAGTISFARSKSCGLRQEVAQRKAFLISSHGDMQKVVQ